MSARLVICPYCGKAAKLVDSAIIYRGVSYGMIWLCAPCEAYVGTHKNSKDHAPLGRLADRELREWKIQAHAAFDPLWREKNAPMRRKDAYKQLAESMGIAPSDCHIGMFDVFQCKEVVRIATLMRVPLSPFSVLDNMPTPP